jgi:hypothetical protein
MYTSTTAFSGLPLGNLSFQRKLESRTEHFFERLDSCLRGNDRHFYTELTLTRASAVLRRNDSQIKSTRGRKEYEFFSYDGF